MLCARLFLPLAIDAQEQELWMTQLQLCTRRRSESSAKVFTHSHTHTTLLPPGPPYWINAGLNHTEVYRQVWFLETMELDYISIDYVAPAQLLLTARSVLFSILLLLHSCSPTAEALPPMSLMFGSPGRHFALSGTFKGNGYSR